MGQPDIARMVDQVSALMRARLGARGATLAERFANRGGALPSAVQRAVSDLVQAEQLVGMPKLAKQMDRPKLTQAHRTAMRYLKRQGRGDLRGRVALNVAATVVLGGVLMVVAVVMVQRLRGGF